MTSDAFDGFAAVGFLLVCWLCVWAVVGLLR